jgi:hypothetical protein
MWCTSNAAQGRYVARMFFAAMLCVLFSAMAAVGVRHLHVTGVLAYVLAILPALPIVGALVITGAYLTEEKDEFQRILFIQSLLGGVALTLSLTTVWGFLQDFGLASPLRLAWVYPMFWIFVLVSFPVVWLRYRS